MFKRRYVIPIVVATLLAHATPAKAQYTDPGPTGGGSCGLARKESTTSSWTLRGAAWMGWWRAPLASTKPAFRPIGPGRLSAFAAAEKRRIR